MQKVTSTNSMWLDKQPIKPSKDACDDLFARQFSYQEINERGNTENVRSRWVSEIRYVDAEATVKLIFALS